MTRKYWLLAGFLAVFQFGMKTAECQTTNEDAFAIRKIHDLALNHGTAYEWLHYLTKQIGARLSGSPQSMAAVEFTRQMLDTLELSQVYLQECMVPHWSRGEKEIVRVVNSKKMGSVDLTALSLGNSIGTGPQGLTAEVIEVRSLDEVDSLGRLNVEGKIVFFNRPFDQNIINTFGGYGKTVDQRGAGASRAGKYGAVAVLVRSVSSALDDFPHTGSLSYGENAPEIPAIAISTIAADLLHQLLQDEPIRVFMRNTSKMLEEKKSYNVIGEIKGEKYPNEVILVGGHLDSWDVGEGAHDDGAGCVHAMEVLRLLKLMKYKPQRTIRCVLFMNEENGTRGSIAYKAYAEKSGEIHLAAIESDRGGFTPRGFSSEGHESTFQEKFKFVSQWLPLLEPYGLNFSVGGSGADISRLKNPKGLLFGFVPDSQRYFDYHHSANDTFEQVNKRELQLGAAAMTSLVYLIDKYGLK